MNIKKSFRIYIPEEIPIIKSNQNIDYEHIGSAPLALTLFDSSSMRLGKIMLTKSLVMCHWSHIIIIYTINLFYYVAVITPIHIPPHCAVWQRYKLLVIFFSKIKWGEVNNEPPGINKGIFPQLWQSDTHLERTNPWKVCPASAGA